MLYPQIKPYLPIHLIRTLEKVHRRVEKLKNRRGRIRVWLLAKGDQDEVLKLKGQLSDASG